MATTRATALVLNEALLLSSSFLSLRFAAPVLTRLTVIFFAVEDALTDVFFFVFFNNDSFYSFLDSADSKHFFAFLCQNIISFLLLELG